MQPAKKPLNPHLKRILVGSAFGLAAALLCPKLPEPAQAPCRLTIAFIHAWVAQ